MTIVTTNMPARIWLIISIPFALLIAGCVNPGATKKADVYDALSVNERQEVKTVNILLIKPAKVEVDNTHNQSIAKGVGALFGAVLGGLAGGKQGNDSSGILLGGAVGEKVGELSQQNKTLVDGVQIIYREGTNTLSSAQVGQLCEYAPGMALAIVTKSNETRIQPNHVCIKGQENIVGKVSNMQHMEHTFKDVKANYQDTVDNLNREQVITQGKATLQGTRTGLTKEITRTKNAEEAANIELDRSKAGVELIRAVSDGIKDNAKNPDTVIIR